MLELLKNDNPNVKEGIKKCKYFRMPEYVKWENKAARRSWISPLRMPLINVFFWSSILTVNSLLVIAVIRILTH